MKRKVALLLAAVMTTAMLPMNAIASSTNQISKKETVQKDSAVSPTKPVCLKIYPKDAVESGSTIILKLENGKFDLDDWAEDGGTNFYYGENNEFAKDQSAYESAYSEYARKREGGMSEYDSVLAGLTKVGVTSSNNYLPYKITFRSKTTADVTLYPIVEAFADTTSNSDLGVTAKVCYNIALPVVASDEGDVKVSVDSNSTSISGGGTYTIATATSSSGSTTTTIDSDDIESFESQLYWKDESITIKEDVAGTFDASKGNVKLKLNSGFEFAANTKYADGAYAVVKPGTNSPDFEELVLTKSNLTKDNQLEFNLSDLKNSAGVSVFATDTTKAASIVIEGFSIVPEDDDKDWGDVNLTVSGGSITTDTIKIATRADYGFYMKAVEEPTTIIAGQTYLANDDLDSDDFETAELMFGETIADTWLTQRKLQFTLPEGVKILGFDIDDTDNVSGGDSFLANGTVTITNDGRTLQIDGLDGKDIIEDDDESEFGITFFISAAATFEGDVTVDVAGAGLAADTLSPVTVATVKAPVTVETTATKANMGYQSMDTSDIVITETVAGALLEDEQVSIALDSSYGSQELGFADDDLELVVDGEVEYKNFKTGNGYFGVQVASDNQIDGTDKDTLVEGAIRFDIDSASYTEPSTLTVKNVKIGTTRAVPYGTYDLKIGDEAVINNYSEDLDQPSKLVVYTGEDEPEDQNVALFDGSKDDAIYVKDYLSIATETGTLDGKVEVTIGESKIVMNGEEVEMDAAAYISNNSTMVPLRFVALAIGVDTANATSVESADASSKIMFDNNSKTATILYAAGSGQKIIQFTAGSAVMVVDGTAITMENGAVAEIKDDRMYVPFRALGTALGVSVSWDEETRTAIYNA